MFEAMHAGKMQGLFILGQNPAVSGPDAGRARRGARKARLAGGGRPLGDRNGHLLEAARREAGGHQDRGLPAAGRGGDGEGGQRDQLRPLGQWRYAAVEPPGDAEATCGSSTGWHGAEAALRGRRGRSGADRQPRLGLRRAATNPDPHAVAREINGRFLADVELPELQADSSAASRCPVHACCATTARRPAATGSTRAATRPRATRWPGAEASTPRTIRWG